MPTTFDPIDLEIRWRRLITMMDELDAAIVRTAFSTIVGESRDFAAILVDRHGRSLAQSQLSTPAFTVTLPITCKHFLRRFPADHLRPGDVLITNDPWLASGHLPDLTICTPVFFHDRLVAFMGCTAHVSDIGGRIEYLDDRDLFEEGLRIPPSLLFQAGRRDETLFRLLEANVRVPTLDLGDIYAITGAEALGAKRLCEFLEDYAAPDLDDLADAILDRSEAVMRKAIASLHPGRYECALDVDGHREPVHIAVAVQVTPDSVVVDFTGSSAEREDSSINCVFNCTFADSYYPFKCSLIPDLPSNEGLLRPLSVYAPEGSIFNARFPRAVRSRSKTCFHIHAAIYGALAQALPNRVQAGSGSFWSLTAYGADAFGEPFRAHVLPNGGKGAVQGRDGLPAIAFPYNGTATPVEIFENSAPVLVERRELLPDSGGPGAYRGGMGQRLVLTARGEGPVHVFVRSDKLRFPAPGILGGFPGHAGAVFMNGRATAPGALPLRPGDRLDLRLPGGGGFGHPRERDPAALARDLAEGYVTSRGALPYRGEPSVADSKKGRGEDPDG